jgi:predicted dehydrogenase
MIQDTIAAAGPSFGQHPSIQRPRLAFLGVGWIGLNRLEALAKANVAEIAAIADPNPDMAVRAKTLAPTAEVTGSLQGLLETEPDGVVIATPSALHAEQSLTALSKGAAVFCQKPLGRNGPETSQVVAGAAQANRLLGVDLSYRCLRGAQRIRDLIRAGELGTVYAVEMAFHNAYGPDKAWFYDRKLSGGVCVMDLGIHLVDLALWSLGFPKVLNVSSRLFSGGEPWRSEHEAVEDYAAARLDLAGGATVHLACSWKLPAGREAIIQASFFGTRGGAAIRNTNGSFYECVAERFRGTHSEPLTWGPEPWGGEALIRWARRLADNRAFDPEIQRLTEVAHVLDRIYAQDLCS